ncbi:MAG: hypothetical protein U9N33_10150, partial [Campylobacterota bacterium]|nr:hypothetical protein [Campylobacterota bacterium]
EMIISNAGGATMTYQPNIDIDNSVYGNMPFQNIPWVLYGGANDPNPERDGIPAMARTKDWIESHGADVRLFIQDEDGDHGGFHMDSENVNAALDIYEDIKNDILP